MVISYNTIMRSRASRGRAVAEPSHRDDFQQLSSRPIQIPTLASMYRVKLHLSTPLADGELIGIPACPWTPQSSESLPLLALNLAIPSVVAGGEMNMFPVWVLDHSDRVRLLA